MPWAPSKWAVARPGANTSPPLPGKGLRTTAALWVLGGTGGQRGWTQGPRGDATLASSPSLGWSSEDGSESTHPSAPALALVRPPPGRGSSGRPPWPPMGLRCHGEPGSLAFLSSTKRPWRCPCPPPPPTRDSSVCRAGRCFLPDGWPPALHLSECSEGPP